VSISGPIADIGTIDQFVREGPRSNLHRSAMRCAPADPSRAHDRFVMLEPRNERPWQGCWKLGTILPLKDLLPERRSFAGMRRLCGVVFPDPA
jgi:hypothetical protein